jgi:tRNA-binding protein
MDCRVEPGNDGKAKHMPESNAFTPAPVKPAISIDDLDKIDIRVGTIEAVEDVAASEKLVRLRVDFGDHKRTILAGMKRERHDVKSEIEGRQALFVVNLSPRKMAGEKSEGMLLDIGYADGLLPVLAVPEKPIPNGSRAG